MSEVEEQKKLEAVHNMFQTEGWRYIAADIQQTVAALGDIATIKDEKSLYFHKGKMQGLKELLFLPEHVKGKLE
jgi:malate synthase